MRLTAGLLGLTTTNKSFVKKPTDSYSLMISTWVKRCVFALTSSWHLTIKTPYFFKTSVGLAAGFEVKIKHRVMVLRPSRRPLSV